MTQYNKYFWQKTVRDSGLSFADQGIIQAMGTYSNKDGLGVRVSQETIAALGGCSVRTVSRAVQKALALGLLQKTRSAANRGVTPSTAVYRLIIPSSYWNEVQDPRTPFYPRSDRAPMSDASLMDQTTMSGENYTPEVPLDRRDVLTSQLERFDRTSWAFSPGAHVPLTVSNNPLTEINEHSRSNDLARRPLRALEAGRFLVEPSGSRDWDVVCSWLCGELGRPLELREELYVRQQLLHSSVSYEQILASLREGVQFRANAGAGNGFAEPGAFPEDDPWSMPR